MSDTGEKAAEWEEYNEYMKERTRRASGMTREQLIFRYQGILYPSAICSVENFQDLRKLQAREDDIFLVAFPKCGTNWTIQILHEILLALDNKEPTISPAILEFDMLGKYEVLSRMPSPRVLASHLSAQNIPESFFEKKTKKLLILRNPKDAAVSLYHFSNKNPRLPSYDSWGLFFQDFISGNVIYGSYFDYYLGWEKHLDEGNLRVLTFEDMKEDLPAQLRKICDFYGYPLTEEKIRLVQEKTTFTSMKEKSRDTHGDLANAFFRKGEIGDWRSLFTEEQSRMIDVLYEKHLADTRIGKMINYAKYCTY